MKPLVPVPCLCVVTDRNLFLGDTDRLLRSVEAAVAGGANMVQLRERGMQSEILLDLAKELRRITRGSALLMVNASPELAEACDGDGVQLPEAGVSVAEARRVIGDAKLIGRSVHSVAGAIDAEREGADFLVAGTIFASRSHTGVEPAGPSLLADIVQQVSLPLLGIGGIGPGNVREVMEAGAHGAAVIAAVLDAPDPEEANREMMSLMMQADILAGRAPRGNDP